MVRITVNFRSASTAHVLVLEEPHEGSTRWALKHDLGHARQALCRLGATPRLEDSL